MSLLKKTPLQVKAEKYYKSLEEKKISFPQEEEIEREEDENLLNFLERHTKYEIEKCLKIAMKPLPPCINKKTVINEIISPMKMDKESQIKSPGSITKGDKEILANSNKKIYSQLKSESKIRSPDSSKRSKSMKEIETNYALLVEHMNRKSSLITTLSNAISGHFALFHNIRTLTEEMKEKSIEVSGIENILNSIQESEKDTLQMLIENKGQENSEFNYLKQIHDTYLNEIAKTSIDANSLSASQRANKEKEILETEISKMKAYIINVEKKLEESESNLRNVIKEKDNYYSNEIAMNLKEIESLNIQISELKKEEDSLKTDVAAMSDLCQKAEAEKREVLELMKNQSLENKDNLSSQKQIEMDFESQINTLKEENIRLVSIITEDEEKFKNQEMNFLINEKNYKLEIEELTHKINEISNKKLNSEKNDFSFKREIESLKEELILQKKAFDSELNQKEDLKNKQKNEWSEIYNNMKIEIEDLKSDVNLLNIENDKLMKQLEITDKTFTLNKENEKEARNKLRKKEEECASLWESFTELYNNCPEVDREKLFEILEKKSLEEKARIMILGK